MFVAANRRVWALDGASGEVLWSASPPDGYAAHGAVTAAGDAVFAALTGGPGGFAHARFEAANGALTWATPVASASTPVVANGHVYARSATGLIALRVADGSVAFDLPGDTGTGGLVALSDRLVCARTGGTCFDPVAKAAVAFGDADADRTILGSDGTRVLEWTAETSPYDEYPFITPTIRDLVTGEVAWEPWEPGLFYFTGEHSWGWDPSSPRRAALTDTIAFAGGREIDLASRRYLPAVEEQLQLWAISERGIGYFYGWDRVVAVNLH